MGEAPQLEQAFLNIILNAAQAMPAGGVLTICSRAVRQKRGDEYLTQAELAFKDTGKGMRKDLRQPGSFAAFETTKDKGVGLGLAIVSRIIEAHQGRIQIKSKIGRGTTICVFLPAK
jgi:signal transduction histidine kinase